MFCKFCDNEIPNGSTFCCWCGGKQSDTQPTGHYSAMDACYADRGWTPPGGYRSASPFVIEGDRLVSYTGEDCRVILPAGIRFIGPNAFRNNEQIVDVVIPEGVIEIGPHAFDLCWHLSSVHLPNTLLRIGSGAFRNTALESITLPPAVRNVGSEAFGCSLRTISIPRGIDLQLDAFSGTGIKEVFFHGSYQEYQDAQMQSMLRRAFHDRSGSWEPIKIHCLNKKFSLFP